MTWHLAIVLLGVAAVAGAWGYLLGDSAATVREGRLRVQAIDDLSADFDRRIARLRAVIGLPPEQERKERVN